MSKIRISTIEPETVNHKAIPYVFCPVPTAMLQDPRLTVEQKGMLAMLLSYSRPAHGHYVVWPGIKKLSEMCRCSERAVRRMLKSLEDKGLISRKRRLGNSSVTTITYMEPYSQTEPVRSIPADTLRDTLAAKLDVDEVDVLEATENSLREFSAEALDERIAVDEKDIPF